MLESLSRLPRIFTIGLIFPVVFLNAWLLLLFAQWLQPLISTLIAATLISFLLDYPIRFLQQRGVRRSIAVGVVFLLFLIVLSVLLVFIVPLILRQSNELLTRLPEWLKSGQQQLKSLEAWAIEQQIPVDLSSTLNQQIERLTGVLRSLTTQVISLVFSAIGSIVNIFLTVVFTIFLVLRGEQLWAGILGWLPAPWGDRIRQSLPQNFERFIVGQATLATIMALSQTAAMVVLRIPLAELFGLGIGAASLIPFGGSTTLVIVSSLLALQNFWLGVKVLIVGAVIIQICENLIGPRIVGELTGLNPVWMLISLDIGLKVGGVLGLLVAVPIAGFIKATVDTVRANRGNLLEALLATSTAAESQPVDVAQ
jgi:predicted PurR-regulated permease PerM